MVDKAYKRMWLLRPLANLTSDLQELQETYCKQINLILLYYFSDYWDG